jgi:hypothetical protein
MIEIPNKEKPMSTKGRSGAWKLRRPKQFMPTYGFLWLHTQKSIIVKAWPKKKLTNQKEKNVK